MLRTVTAATVEPVSLEEAKAHLSVYHDSDDAMIEAFITAAREVVERETGVALAEAEYLWTPEHAPAYRYVSSLPLWPATVGGVTYWDGSARVAMDAALYGVDDDRGLLTLGTYAHPQVAFTTVPVVNQALNVAILLIVGDLYERREASVERGLDPNPAATRLIWANRRNLGV